MKYSYDKILSLYLESITGTLSSEQKDIVVKELESNDEFRIIWEDMERQVAPGSIHDFMSSLDAQEELAALKLRTSSDLKPVHNSKVYTFSKIAAAMCVFIGLSATGYWLIKKRMMTDKVAIVKQISNEIASCQLVLSSGKTVSFSAADTTKTVEVGNSTIIALNQKNFRYSSQDTGINSLKVPQGQTFNLTLSDGTIVMLNAGSTLKFPFHFKGDQRVVYLEGEGFFKVAKDAKHPFIVHTPLTQVKVLGTQFDVNTYHSGKVMTSLVEGKVETKGQDGKSMALSPGFQAAYSLSDGFSKSKFDETDVLSWIDGVYYFHNTQIGDLIDLVSRCYGVKVAVDNPKLNEIAMTGILDKNNLMEFLTDLQTTAGIKFYYSANVLHIQ